MKIYTVTRIDEPDFGCEGRMEGTVVLDKVYLSDGQEEVCVQAEDGFLYASKIDEGDCVTLDTNGILHRI